MAHDLGPLACPHDGLVRLLLSPVAEVTPGSRARRLRGSRYRVEGPRAAQRALHSPRLLRHYVLPAVQPSGLQ